MKSSTYILFLILIIIFSVNTTCPKAKFQFKNKTILSLYSFVESSVGNIGSLETCPYTGRPYVYLPCYPNSSWGSEPYFSNCMKPTGIKEESKQILMNDNQYQNLSFEQVAQLLSNDSNNILNIVHYINEETLNLNSSFDIILFINLLNDIIVHNRYPDNLQLNLYSIVNKLLSIDYISRIQEAQIQNGSFVKLLSLIEIYSQNFIFDELEKSFFNTNFAITIVDRPNSRSIPIIGFEYDSIKHEIKSISYDDKYENSTFIIFDSQTVMKQNRLIFSAYDENNKLFHDERYRILTPIISLNVDKPDLLRNSGSTIKMNFSIGKYFNKNNQKLFCAYWKIFDNNMSGEWSTDGCYLNNMIDQSVICLCNNLTHVAVLTELEQKSTVKFIEQTASIITLTGLLISSIGLCFTIFTFIIFKKLRNHFSQRPLLLLSMNLLFVNILFSIMCLYTFKHLPCTIIASLLHYFILSSFSWMLIVTITQYILFVKMFNNPIRGFTRKSAAFSQLFPLIPVIIVLLIDPLNYTKRTDQICWLSDITFHLSFVLPIITLILIDSVIFCIVTHSILCGEKGQTLRRTLSTESQRLSRFILALSCFISLNLSWIFGLYAIGPFHMLLQILFCLFISLTGFLIFFLYILTSRIKQNDWNNTLKSLGISSIYSPALSTADFLSNKDLSTKSLSESKKTPSRHLQFPHRTQHFIDAYMPSSPPPPAPPVSQPSQPTILIEGDDPLCSTNPLSESRNIWAPKTNLIYEANQSIASFDDYSLFYASNHDTTKL